MIWSKEHDSYSTQISTFRPHLMSSPHEKGLYSMKK